MPWVKLDDHFAEHPKIQAVGPQAAWLHVAALCYCNRNLTDGHIPKAKAKLLADVPAPAKRIAALVHEGLWDEVDDGYVIHDYLEYQPARSKVEAEREEARERMRKIRANGDRSS